CNRSGGPQRLWLSLANRSARFGRGTVIEPVVVDFREPGAARAGGYALAVAGVLVAVGLALHPLPSRGLFEQASVLASTPLWGPIHVAIAMGFGLCVLGGLVMLAAGWETRSSWRG